jgi:hypothetical protein
VRHKANIRSGGWEEGVQACVGHRIGVGEGQAHVGGGVEKGR